MEEEAVGDTGAWGADGEAAAAGANASHAHGKEGEWKRREQDSRIRKVWVTIKI